MAIDDISIQEQPTCPKPSQLEVVAKSVNMVKEDLHVFYVHQKKHVKNVNLYMYNLDIGFIHIASDAIVY